MSTAVSNLTLPPAPAYNDFADWLSPILVKELRQGLKTRMFVSVFILLQAVMIILVGLQLLSMANRMDRGESEMFSLFFWAMIWVPLLIVMPARGFVAVSSEIKASTLDLVQLTRLTAFRIVLGKWVALVAQTLLLVAAVLPYTVLRYFFGGVDVVMDLTILAGVLQGSLLLTALTVMLSSTHLVVRVLIVAVGGPLLLMFMSAVGAAWAFGGMMSGASITVTTTHLWLGWVFGMISTGASIYFLLEMAAGRIAPLAENHSGRRRAVALGVALITPWMIWMNQDSPMALISVNGFFPLCIWAVLEALCERTVGVPSLYRPFARRGWLGRIAGRVFYPGWATGLVFVGLVVLSGVGVAFLAAYRENPVDVMNDSDIWGLILIQAFTAIVAPIYVLRLFPRMKQPFWLYLLIQALCVLLFVVGSIIADWPGSGTSERAAAMKWLAPIPLSATISTLNHQSSAELLHFYWQVSVPVCGLLLGGLVVLMMREFRVIRQMEKESIGE